MTCIPQSNSARGIGPCERAPYSSRALYECLKDLDPQRVVTVDMSNVTFLDSSGLSTLIVAQRAHQAAGGDLLLYGVKPAQKKVFQVTNLDHVFKFDGD